jgi:hypothetical protein
MMFFGESNDIGNHWGYCIFAVAVPYTTINVVVVVVIGLSFDSLHLILYSMLSLDFFRRIGGPPLWGAALALLPWRQSLVGQYSGYSQAEFTPFL